MNEKSEQMNVRNHQVENVRISKPDNWNAIEWQKVERNIQRLQARIVKAEREGRYGKMKSLTRILTRSLSARTMAVKRVTTNQGKETPGVDGQLWQTPAQKRKAIEELDVQGYKAQPLRRVHIPKSNGQKRPLGIPTMKDRAMQSLYSFALDPIAECRADSVSYGFRKNRSVADAIQQCQIVLSRDSSATWILEGDIKGCFDNISHDWLLNHIPMEKQILRQWLKCGYMELGKNYDTLKGTPQGGIISPVLANMTLDGLENILNCRYRQQRPSGKWIVPNKGHKINLVRYADDFIITANNKEVLEQEIKPLIRQFLAERGLTLSEEKTRITHIEYGFDFLGKHIRKYDGKFMIKPSKKNTKAFLDKVRQIIKSHKAVRSYALIRKLNPVIMGWVNFHKNHASRKDFRKVSAQIFNAIWKWAKRRHSKKSSQWIREKYFVTYGKCGWIFFGDSYEGERMHLYQVGRTNLEMYWKIKNDLNPYDPAWRTYLEEREARKVNARKQKRQNQARNVSL